MSLELITIDVQRATVSPDDYGGEALTWAAVYSGKQVTIGFYSPRGVDRFELVKDTRSAEGPGSRNSNKRVMYLEPWDTSVVVYLNDRIVPNPALTYLPAAFNVVGVRPYYEPSGGELQLDIEDISII